MRITSIPHRELMHKYAHVKGAPPKFSTLATSSDSVEFSGEAKTFSATLKAAKSLFEASSAVNTDKVEAIKQQIDTGEYYVPGYRVAGKMLGE